MAESDDLFSFLGEDEGSDPKDDDRSLGLAGELKAKIAESLHEVKRFKCRRGMWTSPSTIAGSCLRALAIHTRDEAEVERDIPTDLAWAAKKGNAFHHVFQDEILGPMGILKGGWACSRCGHVHGIDQDDKYPIPSHGEVFVDKVTPASAVIMPGKCEKCGMIPSWEGHFSYVEPLLYEIECKISGRTDGILMIGGEEVIFDVKTGKPPWGETPWGNHVDQVLLYMGMAKILRGFVLYSKQEDRSFSGSVLPKEVDWDPIRYHELMGIADGIQKINSESLIPDCPYGGIRFGNPCECVGL